MATHTLARGRLSITAMGAALWTVALPFLCVAGPSSSEEISAEEPSVEKAAARLKLLRSPEPVENWTKGLVVGGFFGGAWPSSQQVSGVAQTPGGPQSSHGVSQTHTGIFAGPYLGYNFMDAGLPLSRDGKWKAIPGVLLILNYAEMSSSALSYGPSSAGPIASSGSSRTFLPEIGGVVLISNPTRFVPFLGATAGVALSWASGNSVVSPSGAELVAPGQTVFTYAPSTKVMAGVAIRIVPHWNWILGYATRFIAPTSSTVEGLNPDVVSSIQSRTGWYQDFEGWVALQYDFGTLRQPTTIP
ncbi:hypothetical protein MAMT_01787 [Methylacidimicrobium tartarophylax]|uniref:Outer membrane protein beta-barrel domain-containing protein n=2 Tax=Methylacidimicrobium tartarophylax TaxID=1041768 RepID=A0A5E6MDA9_9BACT|nr:hypothetical protein MAMT_01787 [Methylacidimicrobium tartarophylax]